jgi:membrane associated rhomboid family serine protease
MGIVLTQYIDIPPQAKRTLGYKRYISMLQAAYYGCPYNFLLFTTYFFCFPCYCVASDELFLHLPGFFKFPHKCQEYWQLFLSPFVSFAIWSLLHNEVICQVAWSSVLCSALDVFIVCLSPTIVASQMLLCLF